ncbi:MAG: hypothetical protein ABI887_21975 [Burkholderiales bacterium]
MLVPLVAHADNVRVESLPTSGTLGLEFVRLPHGERMGLVGGSLLFDIGGDWGVGPGVYGAATGERGGLFVGGMELQRRWGLGSGFSLATGLYVGGGGGAAAPVGSGLMLRPALTLLKDIGPTFQLGLSLSSVRFPSGQIQSNQVGLMLGWRQEFIHLSGWGAITDASAIPSAGLGFDRMAATLSSYRFNDGSDRRLGLVGARAERRSNVRGFTWGMEAAAAAKGDAAGYMEVLGTTAFSIAPFDATAPSWRIGTRLSAGMGGGGAVPTGGGLIGKAVGTTEWSPLPGWTLGADYGVVRSRGAFHARQAQVWLGVDLEPGLDARTAPLARVVRTEWVGALQHHTRVPRSDGTRQSLDTIGLKLNRYVDEHFYLSGQTHSAFAGGAGAYSVGLVGVGVSASPTTSWRLGAEALIGAAGGGGVTSAGGAITQGLAWAAWRPGPVSEIRLGVGAMRALHNPHAGPIIELAWSRAFGMAGR